MLTHLTITSIRREAPDVRTFMLRSNSDTEPAFRPGQFLTFLHEINGRDHRRSYSLSAADRLAITVARVPNGAMSRWLIDEAQPGDELRCEGGATGVFTLPDDLQPYSAVWLFAAGIGITPIHSLIESLMKGGTIPVVLFYSNHDRESTVFLSSLQELEARSAGRLRIVWLWSDAQDLRRARLSRESFPELSREFLSEDPERALCFVCGPSRYMWLVQILLRGAGVPPENIRREIFVVDKEVPKRLPLDQQPHSVRIIRDGKSYSFVNTYPETILQSARRSGLALPFSCEAGQCGSCTAYCRQGEVWMSYNEVLTDRDLAAGRVLTCTGHAVGGDVVLTQE